MKKSVVSKEYQNLQKDIIALQENWKESINPESIIPKLDKKRQCQQECQLRH